MKPTEETVSVTHKKNGIGREFTPTQLDLMGKNNRKAFKQATPAEAGKDANAVAEQTEAQKLEAENADLKKQLADALAGKTQAQPEATNVRTTQQLENEGKRVENATLKAQITAATSGLQTDPAVIVVDSDSEGEGENEGEGEGEGESDNGSDPNPELTALRKQYEDLTGKKPGRLGIDKLNEAVTAALKEKGQGPVEPK
jgi:hypothetical protein